MRDDPLKDPPQIPRSIFTFERAVLPKTEGFLRVISGWFRSSQVFYGLLREQSVPRAARVAAGRCVDLKAEVRAVGHHFSLKLRIVTLQ